jgi:PAS domain S-box-containing protein
MKYKVQPTQNERLMRENDFIVSKTDLKGVITYGNRTFIEFSGYTEQELIGKPHNIIRHPDMPRGVFKFLWDTLAAKKECFAYVKNLAKDGSYYWVFANVTPSYNANAQVVEYFSVRRQPNRQAVSAVADVYALMIKEEQKAGPRDAMDASLGLLVSLLKSSGKSYEEFILSL